MNRGLAKKYGRLATKAVALVAVMAATLTAGKTALAAIPNVEIVTLLCALYGYVFGGIGVFASLVFVAIEPLIWGYGGWVITYLCHWPVVALVFWGLARLKLKNRLLLALVAGVLTVWFGVFSSMVDVGLFTGGENFGERFAIYYARGVWFYVTQIACNLLLFPIAFRPLATLLGKLHRRMFPRALPKEPADLPDEVEPACPPPEEQATDSHPN